MVANNGDSEGIKDIPVKTKISPMVVKTCILFIVNQKYKFYSIKNKDVIYTKLQTRELIYNLCNAEHVSAFHTIPKPPIANGAGKFGMAIRKMSEV